MPGKTALCRPSSRSTLQKYSNGSSAFSPAPLALREVFDSRPSILVAKISIYRSYLGRSKASQPVELVEVMHLWTARQGNGIDDGWPSDKLGR